MSWTEKWRFGRWLFSFSTRWFSGSMIVLGGRVNELYISFPACLRYLVLWFREIRPWVSLNKALLYIYIYILNPYFWGGYVRGGWLISHNNTFHDMLAMSRKWPWTETLWYLGCLVFFFSHVGGLINTHQPQFFENPTHLGAILTTPKFEGHQVHLRSLKTKTTNEQTPRPQVRKFHLNQPFSFRGVHLLFVSGRVYNFIKKTIILVDYGESKLNSLGFPSELTRLCLVAIRVIYTNLVSRYFG